jgi:hypothetical protein
MSMIRIILLLIFIQQVGPTVALGQSESEVPFTLVKDDDGIFIYERWISFPKSNPPIRAREVKSVFTVNSTIDDALDLLKDETKIKIWQKHVSEFKVYPINDTLWYEYSYHDIPWPVSDQDHFLEYKLEQTKPGEAFFVTFESKVNNKISPVREDVARMTLAGSWLFEKLGPQKIRITYRILSMPSHIPRIFTDPVIRNNLMSTVKNYIEILEKK